MSSRRVFLQQAGLLAAGLLIKPDFSFGKSLPKKVGLQLYTLRSELAKDVKGTIAKVAQIGFGEVETFGYSKENGFWGLDPAAFKKLMKDNNLVSPSGHYSFNQLINEGKEDELKNNIEAAKGIGQKYLTVPYLDASQRGGQDVYKKLAEKLNRAGELAKKSGLQLTYHNHDFEFQEHDGVTGYDILLKETDPSLLKFELDLFWAVKAGKDPVKMFEKHPGRFVMWHVKDMEKDEPKMFTEVGSGVINFKEIFAKADVAGVKHVFVEQDQIKNKEPFESIRQSCEYVKKNLL
ncbi:sugar phosphate isomerase/epimerase family protein [Rubrolithibacter danxiaensis]|uniref:sugar phosphate isomerase/epimerase family protein n=1 Tax=Rubrolithibacter danxiaensis TaxID=3390805 RepID=UPI003BF91DB6